MAVYNPTEWTLRILIFERLRLAPYTRFSLSMSISWDLVMATFVLVPGAYHGGWCYAEVAGRLRAMGHAVHAPTLTGVGERRHLTKQPINLSTHVQDIVAIFEFHGLDDVILCGHSYAGLVITGVAGQLGERIRTLFYLDAGVPEDGECVLDMMGPERALRTIAGAGGDGVMIESPGAEVFNVAPENVDWVDKLLTSHPLGTYVQKIRFTGKESLVKQRTFVLARQYQSINHATYARVKDLPGWKAVALDCGHDVMIDHPDVLESLLLDEVGRDT